ncbi:NADP-dependent oxidoreductase [Nesterenkonia lutea]|uniref:NADPH:quinone reductase-like Zn-dependent oxidoreductase n=1 Tax=Nesterenkonia lutea TaxID=272919 RepID=A0ABR9JGD4_9MICC|nr:NADP-dependent oxidoreductase [Nesterenkonia lutea]MBE1524993.1 NADPH:quinone reductase-like Zn-dependent oxidoreductase [Nesterenkonia lutea]
MSKVYVHNRTGGPETQELIDRTIPQPGPGELGVTVHAAAVNPMDWKIRSGLFGSQRDLPAPMGREVAGTVNGVGAGVDGFTVGDAILGPVSPDFGGFAEDTIMVASDAVAKPEELSFIEAATIPIAAATAYDGTHQIELTPGQTLLITGIGGGVGLMAAQIGKVHEFRVIGTGSESKRTIVESTGATLVPSGDGLLSRLRTAAPDGVDLILDLVGGDALREVAELATSPERIVSAADPTTAVQLGGTALVHTKEALTRITSVIEYDLVDPHITATFSLARAGEAIAAVEQGHVTGKVVIDMDLL